MAYAAKGNVDLNIVRAGRAPFDLQSFERCDCVTGTISENGHAGFSKAN
jgi:hypothetical protein